MNKESIKPIRALISVSDKSNLKPLLKVLSDNDVELISTGGTLKAIQEEGLACKHVSEITGFPEIMNGRVKTLHPLLLGGILGLRDDHHDVAASHQIPWIDLVVCNLYPFETVIQKEAVTLNEAVENIDIGGPTMVRAAAKNYPWVTILTSPSDYDEVATAIKEGGVSYALRQNLAQKAFSHTARYDALISNYLLSEAFPETLNQSFKKEEALRYGENPHQAASVYRSNEKVLGILGAHQIQGKALSYNNIVDAEAALGAIVKQSKPTAAVIKHAIPCGMAQATDIDTAFMNAFMADEKSAFGGVIALNERCDPNIASEIAKRFVEIVIAPAFSDEAKTILSKKPNLRLLVVDLTMPLDRFVKKQLPGGMLLQEKDAKTLSSADLKVVTGETLPADILRECLFAWHVVKQVKSNAIVVSKDGMTKGIGGGQVSRVDAVEIALNKAADSAQGAVLASDAFFPFRDSIDLIAASGIAYVIQPGGSKRDDEVIAACKEHGITMIFTGHRCFYH